MLCFQNGPAQISPAPLSQGIWHISAPFKSLVTEGSVLAKQLTLCPLYVFCDALGHAFCPPYVTDIVGLVCVLQIILQCLVSFLCLPPCHSFGYRLHLNNRNIFSCNKTRLWSALSRREGKWTVCIELYSLVVQSTNWWKGVRIEFLKLQRCSFMITCPGVPHFSLSNRATPLLSYL